MNLALIKQRNDERIATLDPLFAPNVVKWLADPGVAKHNPLITWGRRTLEQQAQLYDLYINHNGRRAAKPGESYHNYGLAIDFAPCTEIDGRYQPDWSSAALPIFYELTLLAGKYHMRPISVETGHLQDSRFNSWREIPGAITT